MRGISHSGSAIMQDKLQTASTGEKQLDPGDKSSVRSRRVMHSSVETVRTGRYTPLDEINIPASKQCAVVKEFEELSLGDIPIIDQFSSRSCAMRRIMMAGNQ